MDPIQICPYLESCFEILGRRWNGLLIHYLSQCSACTAQFTEMKNDLNNITPRALSLKLTELIEHGLVVKQVTGGSPVMITYQLTDKGQQLAAALQPIHQWAKEHVTLDHHPNEKRTKSI